MWLGIISLAKLSKRPDGLKKRTPPNWECDKTVVLKNREKMGRFWKGKGSPNFWRYTYALFDRDPYVMVYEIISI